MKASLRAAGLAAVLLAVAAVPSSAWLAPQGEWSYAIAHPDPERAREDAALMQRFHQLQADRVECRRMRIGCPEGAFTQPPPSAYAGKSMAQIQREADAAWAYARQLHPSRQPRLVQKRHSRR